MCKTCKANETNQEYVKQEYVTVESARNASYLISQKHFKQYKDELKKQRNKLIHEIISKYIPASIPTDEETDILLVTNELHCYCKKTNDDLIYYDIWDLPEKIKPTSNSIEIPIVYYLALIQIDSEFSKLKDEEENMANRLFEEIIYMRDKNHIESWLPEIMPLLQFKTFIYDTMFWKDVLLNTLQTA